MDVAGRVPRLRKSWRSRLRRPARHQPGQHPLPHRLHRVGRHRARRARRRRLRHRRPLQGPVGRAAGGRRRRRRTIEIGLTGAARETRCRRRSSGRGQHRHAGPRGRRRHVGPPAPLRRRLVPGRRAGRHREPGRGPAAGEGRRRGRPHGRGGQDRRRRPGRGAGPPRRSRSETAHRGGIRRRARLRDAPPGRDGLVVRDDRGVGAERGQAPPPPEHQGDPARRAGRRRLRRGGRRVLLGHDPDPVRR